jgi:hypothetical protein
MPQDSIIEMCADWCAMSEELGDNPVDFMNKAFKTKFKFTPDQKKLIRKTIQKMWPVPVNVAALISGKQI